MSGARYVDWTHVHVVGDRGVAAQHVPYARKLLGFVMDEAQRNGLGTSKIERTLDDGTKVIAEKHGDIPRVTIVPVPRPGTRETPLYDDFVVWARDDGYPDGIDVDYPQQILRRSDSQWRTFFYDASPEHDAFPGVKGTYQLQFPEGVKHAGNVDWTDGKMRLSWYGPSTRYWVDPYVQPQAQYGTQVFMLGQVLLDTADLDPAPAGLYVVGAAIDGMSLYVLQAALPVCPTTTGTIDAGVWVIDPWAPVTDIPHALYRYALAPDPLLPGHMIVLDSSAELLWSAELRTGAMPWFFNHDATQARCHGIPAGTIGGVDYAVWSSSSTTLPSATSPFWVLSRAGDTASLAADAATTTPNGTSVLASDFSEGGALLEVRVRRQQFSGSGSIGEDIRGDRWYISVGQAEVSVWQSINQAGYVEAIRAFVLFADARTGVLITATESGRSSGPQERSVEWAVHLDGSIVHSEFAAVAPDGSDSTGLRRDYGLEGTTYRNALAAHNVSPMWVLYGFSFYMPVITLNYGYQSAHGGFLVLPHQPASYYGARKYGGSAGTPTPVADIASFPPTREKLDFDGKDAVLSVTSDKQTVLFSGYPFAETATDSPHFVSGSTLPGLTGVGGPNERFHPLWRLGKPHNAAEAA